MVKTKEELAEMLYNCYKNISLQDIDDNNQNAINEDINKPPYHITMDILNDRDDGDYIYIINRLLNIEEKYANKYPDSNVRYITCSFENLCHHYLLKDMNTTEFSKLLISSSINTIDKFFFIERENGNITLKSGNDIDYILDTRIYNALIYDICFNNAVKIYGNEEIYLSQKKNINHIKKCIMETYSGTDNE